MASSDREVESMLSAQTRRLDAGGSRRVSNFAGYAVGEAVRTTLGPNGMDKLVVDDAGDFVITNDGVEVLKALPVDHPGANLVIETALAQERTVGDGTTSAVVLTGALVDEGTALVERGLHPTAVVGGYQFARRTAASALRDRAVELSPDDRALARQVVDTVMAGKGSERVREHLAPPVASAFRALAADGTFDRDRLRVESVPGGSLAASTLVDGYAVGVDAVHAAMPTAVSDPDVALVADSLQPERVGIDDDVAVSDASVVDGVRESEVDEQRSKVRQIVDAGADVAFVSGGVGDEAKRRLAAADVLAMRRVGFGAGDALRKLESVTGAERSSVADLDASKLGSAAEVVRERRAGERHYLVRSADSDVRTLFVRGGSARVVREAERAVGDALDALETAVASGSVLHGGGAPELAASRAVRDAATSLDSREQLAVAAFADALEVIPRTLAENAGADPVATLTELRRRHRAGDADVGVDGRDGTPTAMSDAGVVEPLDVKLQALRSAVEAACLLLRIDGVVAVGAFAGGDPVTDDDVGIEKKARERLRSE